MTPIRTALAAAGLTVTAALTVTLAGCGGSARAGVEEAFRGYHAALLARDFRTACSYNAPEATAKLLISLRTQAIEVATCEDAFTAIYAESGGAGQADAVAQTVQIQGITVNGDQATVNWTAQLDGEQRPSASTMRRIDGRWEFVAD
jgi:hypothetical protein